MTSLVLSSHWMSAISSPTSKRFPLCAVPTSDVRTRFCETTTHDDLISILAYRPNGAVYPIAHGRPGFTIPQHYPFSGNGSGSPKNSSDK